MEPSELLSKPTRLLEAETNFIIAGCVQIGRRKGEHKAPPQPTSRATILAPHAYFNKNFLLPYPEDRPA